MAASAQLRREILAQPETLGRILRNGRTVVEAMAERIRAAKPVWVLIAARGSSDNAARYAQYLFGAHNQMGVGLAIPSLFTLYQAPPALGQALVIGISQSGQSPDIIAVLEEARRQKALTLAITNDPGAPLAGTAALHIPMRVGAEKAVVSTKTYTGELLVLAMLSAAMEGNPERWKELETIPQLVSAAIERNSEIRDSAESLRDAKKFLVIGRGFNYSTAFEIALKIKETSYVMAEPCSMAELLHASAMIDQGLPLILIAPSGRALGNVPQLVELSRQRETRLVVISDVAELAARADVALTLPAGIPEWLSPIVAVVPGQLFALAFAEACGLDPDTPRGLSKVMKTL